MPIEFRSGLPGSSKTLGAVDYLMQLRKTEPDRPVYVLGITDLRDGLALPLTVEQLQRWQELPPKSIIVVDECQKYMPARRSGDPPAWIRDLSTHRHLGLDFILISQHPALIDNYVRRLVDRHIHHVRKFGTHWCDRWEWSEIQSDPTTGSAKKAAHNKTVWHFSKTAMEAYKSAEVHTVKRRLPRILYIAAVCALLIPVLLFFSWKRMHDMGRSPNVATVAASSGQSKDAPLSSGSKAREPMTRDEWIKQRIPRVAGMPWSAPLYDNQQVQATPDLYCAAFEVEGGSQGCTCVTEQGTSADIPGKICLQMAKEGVYNPYRKPLSTSLASSAFVGGSVPPSAPQTPVPTAYAANVAPLPPSGGGDAGASTSPMPRGAYIPPEYMPPNR
jgi:zona occludens toxin